MKKFVINKIDHAYECSNLHYKTWDIDIKCDDAFINIAVCENESDARYIVKALRKCYGGKK
jgi:hypothetical protein